MSTPYSWAVPGARCVLVSEPHPSQLAAAAHHGLTLPRTGVVYRLRDVGLSPCGCPTVLVRLREITNRVGPTYCIHCRTVMAAEITFEVGAFRPLQDRPTETSIEVFQRLRLDAERHVFDPNIYREKEKA